MAPRSQVFVVEQDCVYQDLDGQDLQANARHVWIEEGDDPGAYLRLFLDGGNGAARIGRVVTDPRCRGRGLASRVVLSGVEVAGDADVVLDAQSHLQEWYAGLGFVRDGADFVEDGIPHTPMRLRRG